MGVEFICGSISFEASEVEWAAKCRFYINIDAEGSVRKAVLSLEKLDLAQKVSATFAETLPIYGFMNLIYENFIFL